MNKERTTLFYQIDGKTKTVAFVLARCGLEVCEELSDHMKYTFSFDDVFRSMIAFCNDFADYEEIARKLIDALECDDRIFEKAFENFQNQCLRNHNFFARYYSDLLRGIISSARDDVELSADLPDSQASTKSIEYVHNVFQRIREITKLIPDFDLFLKGNTRKMEAAYEKILVPGESQNAIYTVTDAALVNFFYDFSFAIYRLKLRVCTCRCCSAYFFGKKKIPYCNLEDCQTAYQEKLERAKQRESNGNL